MEENKTVKIKIRKALNEDLNNIYECHKQCFEIGDLWYKSIIQQHLNRGYIIETLEDKTIIGIMLQGMVTACDSDEKENFINYEKENFINYEKENFINYEKENFITKEYPGIIMICIHPNFRGKGLAKKLIELHFQMHKNTIVALNTRKSNTAHNLYLKMGYKLIGSVKNKYFSPTEDSYFMIKKLI